jgi:hypothetical protein
MPFVFLIASARFARGRFQGQANHFAWRERYAERVDHSDGLWDHSRRDGYQVARIEAPARFGYVPDSLPDRREVARAAVAGYRDAAEWSRQGEIGVMVGHGRVDGTEAEIEIAPAGAVYVRPSLFQYLDAPEAERPRDDVLALEAEIFLEIGAILRDAHVQRVDFYTCQLGIGDRGQELLDALHAHWRVPVRGLRGDLAHAARVFVDENGHGNFDDPGSEVVVQVLPPSGVSMPSLPPRERAAYDLRFTDRLVEGAGLWVTSRAPRRRSR